MSERLALGIDGGGTRTRAVLVDETGLVRGRGEGGPGNYHDVGPERLEEHLRQAARAAWREAGLEMRPADAVYLGLASVVAEEDHAVVRAIARKLALAVDGRIETGHDLRNALAGGLAGQPGMVLVVGTGSACFGRNGAGETWKAGGWGSRLDDMGSSAWLGLRAMVAAIRAHDGRAAQTMLLPRVLGALGLGDVRQLLKKVDARGLSRSEIAALAGLVTGAAREGDGAAREILELGARELALCAATVAARLDWGRDAPLMTMTGGLVEGCEMYREMIRRAVFEKTPGVKIIPPRLSPTLGAALIALERMDVRVTPAVIERLALQPIPAARRGDGPDIS